MSAMFETAAVSVRAGPKRLLDGVSLSFDPGQAVALIGPNGAGKSTFIRVLAGEIAPHSGHVALNGRKLTSYSPQLLATNRAVLSQQTSMTFPFTVSEVVHMGVRHGRDREIRAVGRVSAGRAGSPRFGGSRDPNVVRRRATTGAFCEKSSCNSPTANSAVAVASCFSTNRPQALIFIISLEWWKP